MGTNWNVAENWDIDQVPTAGDDVTIGSGFAGITSSQTNAIRSLHSDSPLTIDAGTFTITDDSTIDATLSVLGTGTLSLDSLTLDGSGSIDNQAQLTLELSTVNTSLHNQGGLTVFPESFDPESVINAVLTTTAGSTITLDTAVAFGSPIGSTLTVGNGFTNHGTIELTSNGGGTPVVSLNVSTGTLSNAAGGTIRTTGTDGTRRLAGNVENLGTIDIDRTLDVDIEGRTFDSSSGTLDVDAGTSLVLDGGNSGVGGTVVLAAASTLSGSGTIEFRELIDINLLSDFTVPAGDLELLFSGNVTVNGTDTGAGDVPELLINHGSLELTADSVADTAGLHNVGTLFIKPRGFTPENAIHGPLTTVSGSVIVIATEIAFGSKIGGTLLVSNGFENHGTIDLDGSGGGGGTATLTLEVTGGTLQNMAGGSIKTSGGAATRTLKVNLENLAGGTLMLTESLALKKSSGTHLNSGSIDIAAGATFDITDNGTFTQIGGRTQVEGTLESTEPVVIEGGVLGGSGTVAANLDNRGGSVAPGASPGMLQSEGSYDQAGGSLDIELGGLTAGTEHDQLRVSGAVTLSGSLAVAAIDGFAANLDDEFVVLEKQSLGVINGTFSGLPEGSVLAGAGSLFAITYRGGDGNDVALTNVAGDFGDAPAPYPTLLIDRGPVHVGGGPTLGAARDSEPDGQPAAAADGDDADGFDDEDGVTFGSIRVGQLDATAVISVQSAPAGASLDAWIDFNGDGSWHGAYDQIARTLPVVEGDNIIRFDVPSWAEAGTTFARFRAQYGGRTDAHRGRP